MKYVICIYYIFSYTDSLDPSILIQSQTHCCVLGRIKSMNNNEIEKLLLIFNSMTLVLIIIFRLKNKLYY